VGAAMAAWRGVLVDRVAHWGRDAELEWGPRQEHAPQDWLCPGCNATNFARCASPPPARPAA